MAHHPIIQNLHYKTAKNFATNTHRRENPALCTSVTDSAALIVVTTHPESVRSAEMPEGHGESISIE